MLCSYFWLNAGILAVGLVVYAFIARSYTEKPILSSERVSGSTSTSSNMLATTLHNSCPAWIE